jgi:hypothetical protein
MEPEGSQESSYVKSNIFNNNQTKRQYSDMML